MHKFKAVIFDMDGLLLDSENLAYQAFVHACNRFNLGDMSSVFYNCIGIKQESGLHILQDGLGHLTDVNDFTQAWDEHYTELLSQGPIPVKEGVISLLDYVSARGIPMAVATSTGTPKAERKLSDSGIIDYFEFIVGGDQVVKSKPDPEVYLTAAKRLSARPVDCLALEDSENGVRSAVAAGMTVVQIPDLVQPGEELRSLGHIILDSLSDVQTYSF